MRPPEFTGGNMHGHDEILARLHPGFNEAAGIHRRKQPAGRLHGLPTESFNEAAGIHRRKPTRAVLGASGMNTCFNEAAGIHRRKRATSLAPEPTLAGFNEAAGIHRRKRTRPCAPCRRRMRASMRPPEFTGGNTHQRKNLTSLSFALQ